MENRPILKFIANGVPLILVVLTAALMRILPHPPNIAPITGLALFSGAHFYKKGSVLIPLSAMLIADFFLGFHSTMIFVYGSFFVIFIIGKLLGKKLDIGRLFLAAIGSSLLFFFITNFGVWLTTNLYEKTFSGLLTTYAMGIPFLQNTVLGDLFYSGLFFYGYEFLTLFFRQKSTSFLRLKQ